jgi:hypothetical protein
VAAATAFRPCPIRKFDKSGKQITGSIFEKVLKMNDYGNLTAKRRRLPPHSKSLREALGAIRLQMDKTPTRTLPAEMLPSINKR